jgi:hypothetical protein
MPPCFRRHHKTVAATEAQVPERGGARLGMRAAVYGRKPWAHVERAQLRWARLGRAQQDHDVVPDAAASRKGLPPLERLADVLR